MTHASQQSAAQNALDVYRTALRPAIQSGELYEFPFAALDHLDLPLWTVALIPNDGALCDGFGYGPSLTAAQASAWGETIEWYFARQALKQMLRTTSSYNALVAEGRAAVDPLTLCLTAGSSYTHDQTLQWVVARRYPSGAEVLVPIEAVAPRYADIGSNIDPATLIQVPITNGLGAGPSFEHALAHGLLELIQRDGNSVHYRALDRGVAIDLDTVRDPATRDLLDRLDRSGVDVIAKLASTDFGFTNLYVVGTDRDITRAPQPITLSACGEAAHPDRERALAKALREYTMARARKAFNHGPLAPIRSIAPPGYLEAFRPAALRSEDDRALEAMRRWMAMDHQQFYAMLQGTVLAVREHVAWGDLPTVPDPVSDPAELLQLISSRLAQDGLEVLYVEFAPPDAPARVLRAIVPGLEVETMTYRRIGRRNVARLLAQHSPIVRLGAPPAGAQRVLLRPEDEHTFGGPVWLDPTALEAAVGPLYALYREPGRHVLAFLDEQAQAEAQA